MWEDYGMQFASGNPVSLLPIYENSINIATNNQHTMTEAFNEYALWRYFTGDRSIQNNFFEEASGYCTSSIFDIEETYSLWSNKGGTYFINLPQEGADLVVSSTAPDNFNFRHLVINSNNEFDLFDIDINNNINIDSFSNGNQVLIVNTNYINSTSEQINFTISPNQESLVGDLNYDGVINVVDVILIVSMALENGFDILADLNQDGVINIFDVVQIINIILA